MKVKATIERIINQTFEVEVSNMENAYEEIREMYLNGKFIFDKPNVSETESHVLIVDEENDKDGIYADWCNLRVV